MCSGSMYDDGTFNPGISSAITFPSVDQICREEKEDQDYRTKQQPGILRRTGAAS